ncbi:MAG: TIGR00730 family Rossman fold protein [Acidimicrobiales bacterium]
MTPPPDPLRPTAEPAPRPVRSVCVYCASSSGNNDAIIEGAIELATMLAAEDIELIYGGGAVGLMGLMADTVMAAGGRVTGIIPTPLMPREVAHRDITRLIEVASMHARKAEMVERSDAFVALPGGFGTLEELAEVLTWAQLGIHDKAVGLLNIDGFFDHLLSFLDRCIADRVLKEKNRRLLIDRKDPVALLEALRAHVPVHEPKWLTDPDQG